jgi:hypothetical protein
MELGMWKAALAGAVALATIGSSLAVAQENDAAERQQVSAHTGGGLTEAHIAQARAVLHLTPAQRQYWGPVEAALRDFVRHQGEESGTRMQRVVAAAQPLIRMLDDEQKQNALMLARALGIRDIAAAF